MRKLTIQIIALVVIDVFAFYCSYFPSLLVREGIARYLTDYLAPIAAPTLVDYMMSQWWMPIVFIFFIAYEDLYTKRLPFWDETKKLVKAITLSVVVGLAIATVGQMGGWMSRLIMILLWLNALFIIPFVRYYWKKWLFKLGIWKERVLILGAGETGRRILTGLKRETNIGFEAIGFLDDDPAKIGSYISDKKVFGKIKNFTKFVRELKIDTIIIAMPSMSIANYTTLVSTVQKSVKNTLLIPELKGISLTDSELSCLFNEELFLINIKNNLKNPINRFIKRSFDIVLSVILLPILSPVILLLALVIRMDSPGKAFFKQERLGRNDKNFQVIKFRTMYLDSDKIIKEYLEQHPDVKAELENYQKIKGFDPRVTRVGRFLRKTSLDELPQIFNVIKGEMSFTGPRPFLPREKVYFEEHCHEICSVRPGISGLWQVSGRSELVFADRIKLDLWYIKNWSLWLDLIILIKTVQVVLKTEGAY